MTCVFLANVRHNKLHKPAQTHSGRLLIEFQLSIPFSAQLYQNKICYSDGISEAAWLPVSLYMYSVSPKICEDKTAKRM